MALIECPECGNKVSDKAEYCPNCGCPIEEMINDGPSNEDYVWEDEHESGQYDYYQPKKSRRWLWVGCVAILVLSVIGVWWFMNGQLGGYDPVAVKYQTNDSAAVESTELSDITHNDSNMDTVNGDLFSDLSNHNAYTVHADDAQSNSSAPDWLQGSWELTIDCPYGPVATYHLTISGQNARLVEGREVKHNGRYEIKSNYMIVGPREYYINEQYRRLEYVQYRWTKISGGSGRSSSSRYYASFSTAYDVIGYLCDRAFYNSGDRLCIRQDAVYFNGTPMTGAPSVTNFSSSTATVVAYSIYGGASAMHFYVDASNGTVTQHGDVYHER